MVSGRINSWFQRYGLRRQLRRARPVIATDSCGGWKRLRAERRRTRHGRPAAQLVVIVPDQRLVVVVAAKPTEDYATDSDGGVRSGLRGHPEEYPPVTATPKSSSTTSAIKNARPTGERRRASRLRRLACSRLGLEPTAPVPALAEIGATPSPAGRSLSAGSAKVCPIKGRQVRRPPSVVLYAAKPNSVRRRALPGGTIPPRSRGCRRSTCLRQDGSAPTATGKRR